MHLPPNWIERLTGLLAIPFKTDAETLLRAWAKAEGGTASFNPLNTTYLLPGATEYNTDGVRNFPDPVTGLCATALTLANGDYPGILGDLQAGNHTAAEIVQRNEAEFDKWGTGAANVLAVLES